MVDLARAIDALGEAVEAATVFVAKEELAPAAELAEAVRTRHGFLGATVVVALAGGTGSGKSSLLNALAGQDVSTVGAVRPTTNEPLAWIPSNPEPGLVRLLDDLQVERRVGHDSDLPVAVIDLPDYDSVEFEHRATVEVLLPRVDAVIWVLDPQKYSDRALHRDYLIPLAGYGDQFLFVLNQVDRLDETGLQAVLEDLGERLEMEGFVGAEVVTTAARPSRGGALGIEGLVERLTERFETKRTVHAKLLEDVRRAGRLLVDVSGLSPQTDSQFSATWAKAREAAAGGLADMVAGPDVAKRAERVGERLATSRAAGPVGRLGALLRRSRLGSALGATPDEVSPGEWWTGPGLERVLSDLSRMTTDLSTDLGGGLGRRIRGDFAPERLEPEVRASVEGAREAAGELSPPRRRAWWSAVGAVQLVLFAALVGGLVWLWVDGVDRGQVPWNLILIGGAAVLAAALSWAVRASGRSAGRRGARDYRLRIFEALETQLETRIGAGLAAQVAVRDRLAQSLSRLEAETGGG